MNKIVFLCCHLMMLALVSQAQSKFNIGVGVTYKPGILLEFEMENPVNENLSLPLRSSAGFFHTSDYNALTLEISKGFRQYTSSGLFFEQSLGLGAIASFYTIESIWYYDKYGNVIRYKDGANWGFMPSASAACGYNLSRDEGSAGYIWVRPKLYWNLGFRGLNLPYSSVQIGYTYNLK